MVDELIADDFVEHEDLPGLPATRAGVRQLFEMFHAGFSDATFAVDELIAEGDKVSIRGHLTGAHRAEFMGVPASGRTIDVLVFDVFRIDGGKVVEHWGLMDAGTMMAQLTGG